MENTSPKNQDDIKIQEEEVLYKNNENYIEDLQNENNIDINHFKSGLINHINNDDYALNDNEIIENNLNDNSKKHGMDLQLMKEIIKDMKNYTLKNIEKINTKNDTNPESNNINENEELIPSKRLKTIKDMLIKQSMEMHSNSNNSVQIQDKKINEKLNLMINIDEHLNDINKESTTGILRNSAINNNVDKIEKENKLKLPINKILHKIYYSDVGYVSVKIEDLDNIEEMIEYQNSKNNIKGTMLVSLYFYILYFNKLLKI